jgi:DNA polymerase I-like protein with 3'-5' exonuclease and polymerase domains
MWRSLFLPEEGGLWASLDYSQQEPRILTHYAELTSQIGARIAGDRYRNDPTTDNHQMMADLTGLPRGQAKDLFLGKCYGMGSGKMARKMKLPTKWIHSKRLGRMIEVAAEEGEAIIKQFNERAPYVDGLRALCERVASERGYLLTILGRRCRFPLKDGTTDSYDWTFKALNRLIQGSAADQTKAALVAGEEAGYEVTLQVHDELDLTVSSREHAEGLATIMRNATPLTVPSKVDIDIGPNWGEAK